MTFLGKFYVENDTLQTHMLSERLNAGAEDDKQVDQDVNNKMFIVVRNLKSTSSKNVSDGAVDNGSRTTA